MNEEPNARLWLFEMIDTLPHDQFIRVAITLWSIWTARRKAIHEEIYQSPLSTFGFINSYISELNAIAKPSKNTSVGQQSRRKERAEWIPPPTGMAKINCDAAVSRSGDRGVAAAICRDSSGLYLGASVIVFAGLYDPPSLEAMACREALALSEDLTLQRVHVASDCKTVVVDINEGTRGSYSMIVEEIKARSTNLQSCTFVHEGRASNFEAHNLAKYSLSHAVGRHIWLGVPVSEIFPVNIVMNQ
jgi:ribonuclease HI